MFSSRGIYIGPALPVKCFRDGCRVGTSRSSCRESMAVENCARGGLSPGEGWSIGLIPETVGESSIAELELLRASASQVVGLSDPGMEERSCSELSLDQFSVSGDLGGDVCIASEEPAPEEGSSHSDDSELAEGLLFCLLL